ncbi:MAG TPA: AAA family ATPase [candidate division Zixibacteria bacterium]
MDKGAHFYRCDFQVHTPRDLNWAGPEAVTPEERKTYAEELILVCRSKGLDAIAITDHHDFAFFPYIKQAAKDELDDNGQRVSAHKRIVVFPGIEVTLTAPNCQALLILDADFPENLLPSVLTALAITPAPAEHSKHADVQRIPQNVVSDLTDLYQKLNSHQQLKNRFIVLPNVSETGCGTMLRSGFGNFYKSMPCVGGYTDGPVSQFGTGNLSIVRGENREYGFKAIGIFQTSDNRKRNHEDLGKYTTWVKWSEPTAEALRQACLAKESRISQEVPLLPPVFVTSIDVSNSKFMGQIYLEFSQQYNAIIGGRGTGKSTILEYLRWGLCDQVSEIVQDEGEIPGYQEKRRKLIEKTLLPFDSTVQISFVKNNVPHILRRKSGTNEMSLKIGSGEFQPCGEEDVRNLLAIQAYSQKQLSSVGVSIEELKRLIYSPIRQTLNEFDLKFEKLRSDIRSCYELWQQKKLIASEIEKGELELKSLTEQVEGLRQGLKGISDQDKATIASHKQYEIVEQHVDGWHGELATAREALETIKRELAEYPTTVPDDVKLPDTELIVVTDIQKTLKDIFDEINATVDSLGDRLNPKGEVLTKLNDLIDSWKGALNQHKRQYESAKQKSTSQESTLKQIQIIEDRVKEIRRSLTERKQAMLKTGDPDTKFNVLKEEWFNAHKEKADLFQAQSEKLNELSDDNLKATLGRGKGTVNLENVLKEIISGSNVRKEKIESLCQRIKEATDPIQQWNQILAEFEAIAHFDPTKTPAATLPATPILSSIGFSANDLRKIAEKINSENWIDLFLVQLDDLPLFEYRTREGEYIEFTDASAGQQATSLMRVLLNQEGPPLIIDQPEDDLDNRMVSDIATLIWKSKKTRQLIFTSHNANIVVNGDAELVVCCGYKVTGDQSKGEIKNQGAIDIEEIREEIIEVMEGGEAAFKLRKEKFGF